ncbi:hypothetical protein TRFO_41173 [Tritrichomonas foetus]|uniref:Uncharacterized protein n=1 Tax=Tritrichomonas foetus TaxID=1144522 RepID=A0A1J4L168_9EUKA|nr:hypothetical protein TRFO_41173 [Tritrichomonas foetus]|eukprot:OHT17263.1 hypothetical protein TRFO_41173 [Tritrichomonas foetus]
MITHTDSVLEPFEMPILTNQPITGIHESEFQYPMDPIDSLMEKSMTIFDPAPLIRTNDRNPNQDICKSFPKFIYYNSAGKSKLYHMSIYIFDIASKLKVFTIKDLEYYVNDESRKIYEILKVYRYFGIVVQIGKSKYRWNGDGNIIEFHADLNKYKYH